MNSVTDHADTIRRLLPLWHVGGTQGERLLAELEAMEAERQQAIDALREIADSHGAAFIDTDHGSFAPAAFARAALVKLGEQP